MNKRYTADSMQRDRFAVAQDFAMRNLSSDAPEGR